MPHLTYRRWFSIFFLVLAAAAVVLFAALLHTVHVVRQPGFPFSFGDPFIATQDFGFVWHDRQCDILIYGDSTANVGLDPSRITAQTGISSCNIATSRPVVDDLGTLPLDAFLSHNPAPKLLVLQFGPETFYRWNRPWEHAGPFAPLVMLSRNEPASLALMTMLRHPAETTQFVLFILQREIFPYRVDRSRVDAMYQRMLQHAIESNGELQLEAPAISSCSGGALPLGGAPDVAWVRGLRARYEARGIRVLVRAAAVPPCDPQLAQFQHDLAGVIDGRIDELPVNFFSAGDRHTTSAGTAAGTDELIAFLRANYPEFFPKQ